MELVTPGLLSPPPFLVTFSDWFMVARYRGKGRVIDLPFFDATVVLLLVILFEVSIAAWLMTMELFDAPLRRLMLLLRFDWPFKVTFY